MRGGVVRRTFGGGHHGNARANSCSKRRPRIMAIGEVIDGELVEASRDPPHL
jgi:hypothetical protein